MNKHQAWLPEAVDYDLQPFASRAPNRGYRLWRCSTLNRYRGVIELEKRTTPLDVRTLEMEIRAIVAEEFRPRWTWLRGFAFGVCVFAPAFPRDAERLPECIDIYNRQSGAFQWLIYVAHEQNVACAIHTWSEGYLSPTLRRLVSKIEAAGLACPTFVRSKGPLFEFAAMIGRQPLPDFRSDT